MGRSGLCLGAARRAAEGRPDEGDDAERQAGEERQRRQEQSPRSTAVGTSSRPPSGPPATATPRNSRSAGERASSARRRLHSNPGLNVGSGQDDETGPFRSSVLGPWPRRLRGRRVRGLLTRCLRRSTRCCSHTCSSTHPAPARCGSSTSTRRTCAAPGRRARHAARNGVREWPQPRGVYRHRRVAQHRNDLRPQRRPRDVLPFPGPRASCSSTTSSSS
jgi:hypothetical protein